MKNWIAEATNKFNQERRTDYEREKEAQRRKNLPRYRDLRKKLKCEKVFWVYLINDTGPTIRFRLTKKKVHFRI